MTALTLALSLFFLPAVQGGKPTADPPKKEASPPKAVSDQYCIHLSVRTDSGGWKWDPQATHCENTEGQLCDYICRNYPPHLYTQVNCGSMATAANQYVVVPPRHTPNDTPVKQTICVCVRPPAPIMYGSPCAPCAPVCKPACERPRLFSRLCGRR